MRIFYYYISYALYWAFNAPFFNKLGVGSRFLNPLRLSRKYIKCGRGVYAWKHCRIEAVIQYNDTKFTPLIEFEDGVTFQQNAHITCAKHIFIGKNTACAANVTITDIHHEYEDINIPIEKQDIKVSSVKIGGNCKICNNVVILPGASIGDHVTIGANAVVGGFIPAFSVVVGCPCRVIKRYDFESNLWRKTSHNGGFVNNDR